MSTLFKQVADNAVSTTSTNLSSIGVTSIATFNTEGSKFPVPGNGFFLTLWNGPDPGADPNAEKVLVSARSGDVLTISATGKVHISPCNIGLLDVSSNVSDLQTAVNGVEVTNSSLQAQITSLNALVIAV